MSEFKRLTVLEEKGWTCRLDVSNREVYTRLAEYENTDISPMEIKEIADLLKQVFDHSDPEFDPAGECKSWCERALYHVNKVNEYRRKITDGLLTEFPCKLGDKIYVVTYGQVHELEVDSFRMHPNNIFLMTKYGGCYPTSDIGKTVFFDRNNAEMALNEARK